MNHFMISVYNNPLRRGKPSKIVCYFLIVSFLLSFLSGCGVNEQEQIKILQIIHKYEPNIEKIIQKKIEQDKRINNYDGRFDWRFKKDKYKDKFIAKYGYFGFPVWWKALIGFGVGLITTILTFGFFSYNPYPVTEESGLYIKIIVDIKKETIKLST